MRNLNDYMTKQEVVTKEKFTIQRDEFGFPIKVKTPKPKPKTKPEADVQMEIAKAFVADGWEVIRYNSGSMTLTGGGGATTYFKPNRNQNSGLTKGHPDIVAFKNCTCVRIEVKSEVGRLSPDQKKYAENALKYGNPIVVLRSKTEALELIELLKVKTIQSAISVFQNNHLKGK
jgi:Holliday junction resolvase